MRVRQREAGESPDAKVSLTEMLYAACMAMLTTMGDPSRWIEARAMADNACRLYQEEKDAVRAEEGVS